MATIATNSLRQASRLRLKQAATLSGLRSPVSTVVAITNRSSTRRGYVSETKRDSALVSNVDTAIRADQKAFFQETGKLPERQVVPGTDVNADAMMSPMAGVYHKPASLLY